jgi:hypothetical protein
MTIAQLALLTRNRQPHETQAGVRYKTLDAAVAEFTALQERVAHAEDRAAACTCQPVKGFEIDTKRAETPAYAAMRQAGVDRMLERAGL